MPEPVITNGDLIWKIAHSIALDEKGTITDGFLGYSRREHAALLAEIAHALAPLRHHREVFTPDLIWKSLRSIVGSADRLHTTEEFLPGSKTEILTSVKIFAEVCADAMKAT